MESYSWKDDILDDEKALEVDSGNDYTTLWVDLIYLNTSNNLNGKFYEISTLSLF